MVFPHVKLKQKREELGLSRKELAERCGLTWRGIESLEQGLKPNPTLETLAALCKGLEVDCGFFFTADAEPVAPPVVGRPPKAKAAEAESAPVEKPQRGRPPKAK